MNDKINLSFFAIKQNAWDFSNFAWLYNQLIMNFIDIIRKKARKNELNQQEIVYMKNIVGGKIPNYLITTWLMTFYINNCSLNESYFLTLSMWKYSEKIDLTKLNNLLLINIQWVVLVIKWH